MRTLTIIIAICWIVFWIYWIISAVGAKKGTRSTVKQFFAARVAVIILAAILAPFFNKLPQSAKSHLFGPNKAVLAAGFIAYMLGLLLAVWARVYLGKNWGMPMTEKQDPELVTTGPYRYVRHPIYTGILLMVLGSAVDVNGYWLLVFIIAAVFFVYSALAEERLMTQQFPKAYPPYKAKTKMLIPFVF